MSRWVAFPVLLIGFGCLTLPTSATFADDPKEPAEKEAAPTATNWSKFIHVTDVVGQVTKADSSGFTLRMGTGAPPGAGQMGRGQMGKGQMGRGQMGKGRGGMQQQVPEYDFIYAEGALVRRATLPPKTDENGKKVAYTSKETSDLRKPSGVKGFAAERSDLQVGSLVEVSLVRPKEIPAAKAQTSDLRVKTVIIQKEGNGATPTPNPRKKNNN